MPFRSVMSWCQVVMPFRSVSMPWCQVVMLFCSVSMPWCQVVMPFCSVSMSWSQVVMPFCSVSMSWSQIVMSFFFCYIVMTLICIGVLCSVILPSYDALVLLHLVIIE